MGNCHCILMDESNSNNCDICNHPLHGKYYFCEYCKNLYHSNCLYMHYSSSNICVYCKKHLRMIDPSRVSRSENLYKY